MDKLENYLYLVFALIYIISRILKAKSKPAERPSQPTKNPNRPVFETVNKPQPTPKKTMSFEDILKEFEKNISGMPEETPVPVPEPRKQITFNEKINPPNEAYETYEGVDYEDVNYDRPSYESERYETKAYENADFKYESSYDLSLDKRIEFLRSENYAIQSDLRSEFIRMLREPNGAKNAIVLGEIINRKYF